MTDAHEEFERWFESAYYPIGEDMFIEETKEYRDKYVDVAYCAFMYALDVAFSEFHDTRMALMLCREREAAVFNLAIKSGAANGNSTVP